MNNKEIYIYESPDSGDTIYRRLIGTQQRELVKEGALRKMMQRSQLWREILAAAETDQVLQEMINKVEVYHRLKNTT